MKLKDHLTELIAGESQYLGPGDDIWNKLDELGVLEAEVMNAVLEPRNWQSDGHAHDVTIFITDPAPADLCKRAEAAERVRIIVVPLED